MEYSDQIVQILILGTLAMTILVGAIAIFVVVYQKKLISQKVKIQEIELTFQKRLLHTNLETQEQERKKIAGDLHDGIGSILNTAKLSLLNMHDFSDKNSGNQELINSANLIKDALDKVRSISKELMPPTLIRFGLEASLRELCNKTAQASGISIEFTGNGQEKRLDRLKEISLYRIAQELVNNALKHANADQIQVQLLHLNNFVELSVIDSGIGFDFPLEKKNTDSGIGLLNIESRVQLIGANLDIQSTPGKGTDVKISLALEK